MGDRGHNKHGSKSVGAAVPLSRGELGPCLTQCSLGRGLLSYQVAASSIQSFGHNRHGLKTGGEGAVPLLGGGAATPSNTTLPGPMFTSVPSGIKADVEKGCAKRLQRHVI